MPHVETFVDGVWYPSVSTILAIEEKPWLQAWREKWGEKAERKMKIANAIGTDFHKCVEDYLNHGCYNTSNARMAGMMRSFVKWTYQIDGIIESTELKVVSKTHTYSGTLDAVGFVGGKNVVVDWKTSSRIYDDMQLQLSAYAQAYNEQTGNKIKDGLIVHVSKDKPDFKVTIKEFKLGKRVFNKFLKLRQRFDEIQKTCTPQVGSL